MTRVNPIYEIGHENRFNIVGQRTPEIDDPLFPVSGASSFDAVNFNSNKEPPPA